MHDNYATHIEAAVHDNYATHIEAAVQEGKYPILVSFISIEEDDLPVISDWADYIDVTMIEELAYINYDEMEYYPRAIAPLYRGLQRWYNLYPSVYVGEMLNVAKEFYMKHFGATRH